MLRSAYIFRLRHAETGREVSAIGTRNGVLRPDHGWDRSFAWNSYAGDASAAVRGESGAFVVLSAVPVSVFG